MDKFEQVNSEKGQRELLEQDKSEKETTEQWQLWGGNGWKLITQKRIIQENKSIKEIFEKGQIWKAKMKDANSEEGKETNHLGN